MLLQFTSGRCPTPSLSEMVEFSAKQFSDQAQPFLEYYIHSLSAKLIYILEKKLGSIQHVVLF